MRMKRFSASFLIVAALMLVLALPAFANTMSGSAKQNLNASGYSTNMNKSDAMGTDYRTGVKGYDAPRYDRVTTDGNYDNYGTNPTHRVTMNQARYRAAAAADNRMDWGWLGLLGLIGLAGMRGRHRETT